MNVERQAGLEWWQLLELRLIRANVANRKIIMIFIHLSTVEFDAFELWCWRRLVRVPWTARRSNQSILKEINWIFIGRTDVEAPILWPPEAKSQLTWKDPDARKDWRQEEKGTTEDEMVGWHHWLNGHESEQAPGDSERQRSLECYSPWGRKESDTTT